jgi:hypothetical protein
MHWCTFLLALAVPALSLPVAPSQATPTPKRAIWLWESNIIQDSASVATFMSTVTSPDNNIGTVHALIDRDMGNEVWQSFVAKCNASGIAVEALMGDKQWINGRVTDDGPTLQHEIDWLAQYQAKAPANAKFSAIHLDVEPWGLDDWASKKQEHVGSLVEIVDTVKSFAIPLNLPVAADLPFWAHTVPCQDTTLDTCLLPHLDSVTFMTYRNTPVELLAIAMPVLKAVHAADKGRPVWFAVETDSKCAEAELISYSGKSAATLLSDLTTVEKAAMKGSNNFAGIAIHSYSDFVAMES